ncbi:hypothetical protein [Mumia xiangluensis]|uniref:Uncharacterized protein n=1 Tax=Mumia xiangluensis TaxID=1678900 RepID=A0ABW1QN81_9ACTN
MPLESWITVLACGVAILALVAALLAVRALRRLSAEVRSLAGGREGLDTPSPRGSGYSTGGEGAGGSGYSTSGG